MLCSIFSSQVWRAAGLEPKAVGTRLLVHQEREAEEERAREAKAEAERRRAERAVKARRARAAKSQLTPKGLRERGLALFAQAEKRAEEAEAEEAARASRAAAARQAEPSQSKASSLARAEAQAPPGKRRGYGAAGRRPRPPRRRPWRGPRRTPRARSGGSRPTWPPPPPPTPPGGSSLRTPRPSRPGRRAGPPRPRAPQGWAPSPRAPRRPRGARRGTPPRRPLGWTTSSWPCSSTRSSTRPRPGGGAAATPRGRPPSRRTCPRPNAGRAGRELPGQPPEPRGPPRPDRGGGGGAQGPGRGRRRQACGPECRPGPTRLESREPPPCRGARAAGTRVWLRSLFSAPFPPDAADATLIHLLFLLYIRLHYARPLRRAALGRARRTLSHKKKKK